MSYPPHSIDDLAGVDDDGPGSDLERHLNAVHCFRLTDLMGMSHDALEALHLSEHTPLLTPVDPLGIGFSSEERRVIRLALGLDGRLGHP